MLVPVGDHGTAAVPPAAADDVHLGSAERVGAAHDRADVHVVLPVLDRDVKGVAVLVEIGDDGLHRPVPVRIDDVAGVAVLQQVAVVARVVRPLRLAPGPWPDADRKLRLGNVLSHRPRLSLGADPTGYCRPHRFSTASKGWGRR